MMPASLLTFCCGVLRNWPAASARWRITCTAVMTS
jgi:hypothetical protein